jgi:hypothetical protein
MRVKHRTSGQTGTVVSRGFWYAAVKFDGDKYPSTVAIDSLLRLRNNRPVQPPYTSETDSASAVPYRVEEGAGTTELGT